MVLDLPIDNSFGGGKDGADFVSGQRSAELELHCHVGVGDLASVRVPGESAGVG